MQSTFRTLATLDAILAGLSGLPFVRPFKPQLDARKGVKAHLS